MRKKYNNKIYNFGFIVLLALLFVSGYTYILQRMYSESILENTISENSSRTDAMYESVENALNKDDFTKINTKSDMDTKVYKDLQSRLNEYRNMNSARYFYTAKRNNEGKLVYVVDGLDLQAKDFAYPGTYIEKEMIPYISRALKGEFVYSQNIIDTTWGHIFTACYPIHENGNTGKIVGALCIEMDMEPTYSFIEKRNHVALVAALIGASVVVFMMICACIYLQSEHRKREERERLLKEAADAAKKADRAKSTFLFNMSHDIRTPMNAIIGYVNLIKKHIHDSERIQQYIDNIEICSEKLLSLLNNVLDLARIESNKISIEQKAVDIKEVFQSCILMFQNNIDEKKQTFSITTNLKYPYVYVDEIHFSEIVMNIMSNAIKYTERDGHIDCNLCQRIAENKGYCYTIFSIQDNGIGMSEEYVKDIFEIFSRERNSTQSGVAGSGLGMSIVKKLVDLMNGDIQIDSKIGKGSRFTISIPTQIATKEQIPSKIEDVNFSTEKLVDKRILLAEDNDLNAQIAMELLQEKKIHVDRCKNGLECVEKMETFEDGYYDLILMDIQMPIMDGYEATKCIRSLKNKKKASIPIVAMTANAFAEDKEHALQVGMNDHVAKPIDINKLLEVMRKYIKDKQIEKG